MQDNKKAQMNWSVFLAVIIIVVSFLVILFFYWQYNWKGGIDKQTCHQSVVLKASMPNVLDRPVAILPLRCKTNKICITDKLFGTNCEGFKGEKATTIRVSTDEKKQLEDIKDIIANSLYDCWSMMGEGKLDIFAREFAAKKYSSRCVICARIDFDKELKEKLDEKYPNGIPGISEYLDTKPIPNKNMNYSEFLIGFKGERPYGKLLEGSDKMGPDNFGVEQQAIVFQEFARTTILEDITGIAAGIASAIGVGYITTQIGMPSLKLSFISFFAGSYVGRKGGALIGGLIGDKYIASWAFAPYRVSSEAIETTYVKEVTNNGKTCYAKIDSGDIPEGLDNTKLVYGFDESKNFMFGKSGLSEEVKFPTSLTEKQKEFLDKVLEELTVKCYNLRSFQCDDFESYV